MRTAIVTLGFALAACSAGAPELPDDPVAAAGKAGDTPASRGTTDDPPPAAQPDECTEGGAAELCTTAKGVAGARSCQVSTRGYTWSDCFPTDVCKPGDTRPCSNMYSGGADVCAFSGTQWYYLSGCNTPLVLAFDDAPIRFTNPAGDFDLAGRETLVRTDWVSDATPWVVFDRDANGKIDDGTELFGSMTRLPDGERAKNGFSALAPLDADGDGWITARDPAFARLALWRDLNQDRVSSPDELSPLSAAVVALSLDYTDEPRCTAGSCERERAMFVFRDRQGNERQGSVVDVYLGER